MITETKIGARVFGVPEHSGPGWASFARTDRAVSTRPCMAVAPKTATLPMTYLSPFYVTDLGTSTKAQEPPRGAPR